MREREIMMEISNKEHVIKDKISTWEYNVGLFILFFHLGQQISKNQVMTPNAETEVAPRREDKEAERREFGELFVNLSDDESDTELLDFTPKKVNITSILL